MVRTTHRSRIRSIETSSDVCETINLWIVQTVKGFGTPGSLIQEQPRKKIAK